MRGTEIVTLGRQVAVLVALAGTALAISLDGFSVFHLPKMTIVAVAALSASLLTAERAWNRGSVRLRWDPATIAAVALAIALLLATVTSSVPMMSVLGEQTRRAGLLSYASYLVLFVVTANGFDRARIGHVARVISFSALAVAGYGAIQELGLDPIVWGSEGVHSTLGNQNYVAAYLGIAAPLALWAAFAVRDPAERAIHVASFASIVAVLPLTRSVQGAPVTFAALGVLIAGWLSVRTGRVRSLGSAALGGAAMVVTALFAAGLAGLGPIAALADRPTVLGRVLHWRAALSMWREHPFTGVGLEMFHAHVRQHRPPEVLEVLGPNRVSASPHNLFLDMLASGGLVLGLAYLAFVVTVGVLLVRGLLRSQGPDRLLLAALGGAWVGYQIQSLVSLDVPSLAVLHYVLAGAIVAVSATAPGRVHRLRRRTPGQEGRIPIVSLVGTILAIVLAAAVLRADVAAGTAAALQQRSPDAALGQADLAVRWSPWEPRYRELKAEILERVDDRDAAVEEWERLLDHHPRWLQAHIALARLAVGEGDGERAEDHYRRVIELEPLRPAVRREVARFELEHDRPERAVEMLEVAVAVLPEEGESWRLLARAYDALGDEQRAEAARERAEDVGG